MKEEIQRLFDQIISGLVELLPRLLFALVIAILGYFLARLVRRLVKNFILYLDRMINEKVQTDRLSVNLTGSSRFVSKTFFWIVILLTLTICLQILRVNVFSLLFGELLTYLPNVVAAVIIVFAGVIGGRLAGDLVSSSAVRSGMANGKFIGRAVRFLILFVAVVISIDQLGIDIGFLSNLIILVIASLLFGASLSFALGAKTSISNVLGAYYVRRSFDLGTTVKVGEDVGVIVKITDHDVAIETKTGLIHIPAKEFNEMKVTVIKPKDA